MAAPGHTPVLILTGPPGAGKTTAATILAERHERAVHLESDFFFHAIRSGLVEPWRPESREQNEVVMRIVAGAAATYAAAGFRHLLRALAGEVQGVPLQRTQLREVVPETLHDPAILQLGDGSLRA